MLKEKLLEDMKNAMRAKDKIKKNTIQLVRTEILQKEKDEKIKLNDDDIIVIISKQLKKRKSSLPEYIESGRENLVEELKREIEILQSYLPEQLSDQELRNIVEKTLKEINATSMRDMGKAMESIIEKVKGKADNGKVSRIVRELLS